MTLMQLVSVAFVAAMIAFLMAAFFKKEHLSSGQIGILRFLCSICAGFAGALFIGDALFKGDIALGAWLKATITGGGGCALFFTVWFTYDSQVVPPDAFVFAVPSGWVFRQAADVLASRDQSQTKFTGFSAEQLETPLKPAEVKTRNVREALEVLHSLAPGLPAYDVKYAPPYFVFEAKPSSVAGAAVTL